MILARHFHLFPRLPEGINENGGPTITQRRDINNLLTPSSNHIITIIISLQLEHPMNNKPRLLGCDLSHAIVIYSTQLWFVCYKNKTFPVYINKWETRMRSWSISIVGLPVSINTRPTHAHWGFALYWLAL